MDRVERLRGSIPACSGRGGDAPTERPNSALTCTDPSELVVLSPRYGPSTGTGGGVEAVVRSGTVGDLESGGERGDSRRRAGPVGERRRGALPDRGDAARQPARGAARAACGRCRAASCRAAARRRRWAAAPQPRANRGPLTGRGLRAARGARLLRLVRGLPQPTHPRGSATRRSHPACDDRRAAAGLERGGDLSRGGAGDAVARARDALNLDGGGSTTMTVRGAVVNLPSDPTGERPVSDGVFVLP